MAESFLSQEEVDALLSGVCDEPEDSSPPFIACDLSGQERVTRSGMPRLETINETFAKLLRANLSKFLRRTVSTSSPEVHRKKYSAFMQGLGAAANLTVVRFKPLQGLTLIALDADLVFLIIDRMFGGEGRFHSHPGGRDLTHTEHRITRRLVDVILSTYAKAWEPVLAIVPEYVRTEPNAQLANVTLPNSSVIETTLSIVLGSFSGEMRICTPYAVLEPIQEVLCNVCQDAHARTDGKWAPVIAQHLQDAEIELVAQLGGAAVTLRDILNMKQGDVIPLSIRKVVAAEVDSIPVMDCTYGVFNGRYALRVEKVLARRTDQMA
jgi:flagellar motor switch protein FliM